MPLRRYAPVTAAQTALSIAYRHAHLAPRLPSPSTRSLNQRELSGSDFPALTVFPEVKSIRAGVEQQMGGGLGSAPGQRVTARDFTFDGVFDDRSSQEDVYDRVIKPMTSTFLSGINVTAMAVRAGRGGAGWGWQ